MVLSSGAMSSRLLRIIAFVFTGGFYVVARHPVGTRIVFDIVITIFIELILAFLYAGVVTCIGCNSAKEGN